MDSTTVTVDAPAGRFTGRCSDAVTSWRGIRYAEAPRGDLRWRAPVPVPPLEDACDATQFGAACPQQANPGIPLPADVSFDEDCLSLNVWAPADRTDALPVMVWVHGGAYTFGSSCQPLFDATSLVTTGNIVIVTINYRLGGFGFLDLTGLSPDVDSNLALRDVLLALRWVQDNIAAFGGDPDRVTVAGESAGGGLVTALLATPSAQGLFHRAIAESSPVSSMYGTDRSRAVAERFLAELGLPHAQVAMLRTVPADQIVAASMAVFAAVPQSDPGVLAFAPVVDGDLLPEAPVTALHGGRGLPVPLLIGTNKDEAALFKFMKSPLMPISEDGIQQMLGDIQQDNPTMQLPTQEQVRSTYEHARHNAAGLGIARDIGFRMPTVWAVEGHSAVADTWLYRFDYATPFLRLIGLGATHATELPYLWGNLSAGPKDPTFLLGGRRKGERVSQRMQARWAAFVHGGPPDGSQPPSWIAYDGTRRACLVIDGADTLVDDLDSALRASWGDGVISFH